MQHAAQSTDSFFVPRLTLDAVDRAAAARPAAAPPCLEPFEWYRVDDEDGGRGDTRRAGARAGCAEDVRLDDDDALDDTVPIVYAARPTVAAAFDEDTTAVRPMSESGAVRAAPARRITLDDELLAELCVMDLDKDEAELEPTDPMRLGSTAEALRAERKDKAYSIYRLGVAAYREGDMQLARLQMQLACAFDPDNRIYRLALERFTTEANRATD